LNPSTERLLAAPIVPSLARLSAPGVLLVAFQSLVSIGDTYFVGRLGTASLAGLALVFPLIMLLQMTSARRDGRRGCLPPSRGSAGESVGGAPPRGSRAGHRRGMGAAFTVLILLLGPAIYALLGGKDETLANAVRYSNVVFAGAITVWMANTLSSVLRGTGNMLVPALTLIVAALVHLPLSAFLVSRIGIAGAGIAYITTFGIATAAMAVAVFRRSSTLRPARADLRLERRLFRRSRPAAFPLSSVRPCSPP
jgi:Na+-driven multidrug efflux pump